MCFKIIVEGVERGRGSLAGNKLALQTQGCEFHPPPPAPEYIKKKKKLCMGVKLCNPGNGKIKTDGSLSLASQLVQHSGWPPGQPNST